MLAARILRVFLLNAEIFLMYRGGNNLRRVEQSCICLQCKHMPTVQAYAYSASIYRQCKHMPTVQANAYSASICLQCMHVPIHVQYNVHTHHSSDLIL